jgi:hypothetical protein
MKAVAAKETPIGIQHLLERIRREFPKIKFGYFNPPKERFTN